MRLLLDTHVWVWSQQEPEHLGPMAKDCLLAPENQLFVATISSLEIARLVHRNTLTLHCTLERWIQESLDHLQGITLEMSHAVACASYQLPSAFHKDPADRILAATANLHDLILLTADDPILGYDFIHTQDARK